jgi:hypothetical protein
MATPCFRTLQESVQPGDRIGAGPRARIEFAFVYGSLRGFDQGTYRLTSGSRHLARLLLARVLQKTLKPVQLLTHEVSELGPGLLSIIAPHTTLYEVQPLRFGYART